MEPSEAAATVVSLEQDEPGRTLTVHLDDGSRLSMASDAPEARGISPGLPLAPDQLEGLHRAASRKEIARRIFSWLDRRPRCRQDLRRRLLERGHDGHAVDVVLDSFERSGLVDDRAYAQQFCEEKLRSKPAGPFWLLSRLRQQGVGADDARAGLEVAMRGVDEIDLARSALLRRRLNLGDRAQRDKAARYLAQRGFSRAVVRRAILDAPSGDGDFDLDD